MSETAAWRAYHSLSSRICRLGTRSGLWPDMSVNNAQGYENHRVYLYDIIEAVVAVAHFRRILGRPVRPSYHADRPLRILGLLRAAVRLCMGIKLARTSRALFWGWSKL